MKKVVVIGGGTGVYTVLSGLKKIRLCIAYKIGNKKVGYEAHDANFLNSITPVYEEFIGWSENISNIRSFVKLPKNAQLYVEAIEKYTQIPVAFISVGPERGQVIYK